MKAWDSVTFESLYSEPSRNGLTRPKRVRGKGYKMINMGEIFAHDRIGDIDMEYVPMNKSEINRFNIQKDDLLFARQSLVASGAGKCSIVSGVSDTTTFESHLIRVRINKAIADPSFYFYYFRSPQGKANVQSIVMQVAAAGIRGSELAKLFIPKPSPIVQLKISSILSAYDDLIENNTRRIAILEEMAQMIYREWFVKFRFPGYEKVKMVDSPLGKIPEGWGMKTVGDILSELESGTRPSGGIDPDCKEIPSIGAENILGLGKYEFSKEKFVTEEFFERMNRGHIKGGDVLLYKDGAKIGRKSMFRDDFPHDRCCINEHAFILRTNSGCNQNFLYFWLDLPEMTQKIINLNTNAAQPGINQEKVKGLPILIPTNELLEEIEEILEPLLGQIFNLAKKNIELRKTRDLLLPKLISGELDVSDLDIEIPVIDEPELQESSVGVK